MPGIAGIVGNGDVRKRRNDIAVMVASMCHDPSYVSEIREDDECGVSVGWLAHPGSYAHRASGVSADGLTLALAGECFHLPRVVSVSHEKCVLRERYRHTGSTFVSELNGLFSGLLLDARRGTAWLFNDRYGAERIYYHEGSDGLYFASEAKALLSVLPELRAWDEDGVAQYLAYGSTSNGSTLFRNVHLMPGGSIWTFERGSPPRKERYFRPADWESQGKLSPGAFEEAFVETARTVIPEYAKSESQIGISITGGLDTRMIMACLPPSPPGVLCYTYGASSGDTLDVRIGRRVAASMGLHHHTLRVNEEFLANYPQYVDRTVHITDGCLGALGAHELFFSAQARALAPIRLTGNFGSEILRSMTTLKPLKLEFGLLNSEFRSRVHAARRSADSEHPVTQAAFDEVPLHLFGALASARSQLTVRTPYLDNALVGLAYSAPLEARRSPSSSLRLIATGVRSLGTIPTDRGFSCGTRSPWAVLRRLFCEFTFKIDYLDKEGLPPRLKAFDTVRAPLARTGILGLHKFLPYRSWFRNEFSDYIADTLGSSSALQQTFWNPDFLAEMSARHVRGTRNYLREINAVLTLDAVERTLIRGLPRSSADQAAVVGVVTG